VINKRVRNAHRAHSLGLDSTRTIVRNGLYSMRAGRDVGQAKLNAIETLFELAPVDIAGIARRRWLPQLSTRCSS